MKTLLLLGCAVAAVWSLFNPGRAAASTIDTTPFWNRTDYASAVGEYQSTPDSVDTASFGQTITVGPTDTRLNSFLFFVYDYYPAPGQKPMNLAAYVMAWDGAKAVGPVLY